MKQTIIDLLAEAMGTESDYIRQSLQTHLLQQDKEHRAVRAIAQRGETVRQFIDECKEDRYVYCYLFVDLYEINVSLANDITITTKNAIRTIVIDYTDTPTFTLEGIGKLVQLNEYLFRSDSILSTQVQTYRIIAKNLPIPCYLFHGNTHRCIGYTTPTSPYPLYFETKGTTEVYAVLAKSMSDAKKLFYSFFMKPVH
jgi:hypothetical protein